MDNNAKNNTNTHLLLFFVFHLPPQSSLKSDRLYSSHHLIPRAHSAVSLETPSSETASVDSSNRRHNSIPNGNIQLGTGGSNHFTDCIGSGIITNSYSMDRSPQKDVTTITISECCNNNNNNSNTTNNNIDTNNSNNNLSTTSNNVSSTKKNGNRRLSIKEPSDSSC